MHSTTIICIRRGNSVAMAGDGQLTLGDAVMKHSAKKVRRLAGGSVISGFAGGVADSFTLYDKFEQKLTQYRSDLVRACVELVKDWRTDKYLRRLEATLLVADKNKTLLLSGNGELIEPEDEAAAIGSGGNYARSAALALLSHTDLSAADIAKKAMEIAGRICIYTNNQITMEEING